jgi:hypothetical protein
MKYSEYDAHLALSKRAELARQTVVHVDPEDPVGFFHGMYWAVWTFLVCGAALTSLVGCMP